MNDATTVNLSEPYLSTSLKGYLTRATYFLTKMISALEEDPSVYSKLNIQLYEIGLELIDRVISDAPRGPHGIHMVKPYTSLYQYGVGLAGDRENFTVDQEKIFLPLLRLTHEGLTKVLSEDSLLHQ